MKTDKEIIKEAFFALCEYQSPSLNKRQREKRLGRCWEILSEAVYSKDEVEDEVPSIQT